MSPPSDANFALERLELTTDRGPRSLPGWVWFAVVAVCLLSAVSGIVPAGVQPTSGAALHVLLEWSAVGVATMTFVLSVLAFATTGVPLAPVLGAAMVSAGLMDAFHTLASAGLIPSVSEQKRLIPFSWAVCRGFKALVGIVGVAILWRTDRSPVATGRRRRLLSLTLPIPLLGGVAVLAVTLAPGLPVTHRPDAWITRPWDVGPALLMLASVPLFRALHRREGSVFTDALLLSTVPDLATQLHMALGSRELFDVHFHVAHGLKLVAYVVPLMGLLSDYVQAQRHRERTADAMAQEAATHQALSFAMADQQAMGAEGAAMRVCMENLARVGGWAVAHIYVRDEHDAELLRPSGVWFVAPGVDAHVFQEVTGRTTFLIGVGLPGRVLRDRRTHAIADVLADPNYPRAKTRGLEVRGALGVPITVADQVVAVMEFYRLEPAIVTPGALQRWDDFGRIVSVIVERARAMEAAESAREQATLAAQAQSRFLAMMSHEIRTPLANVIGALTLHAEKPDDSAHLLPVAVRSAEGLMALLNDVLDLSKIDAGAMLLERRPFAARRLISGTVETFATMGRERGLDVEASFAGLLGADESAATGSGEGDVECVGDPSRVRQVLVNLLGNAMKFSDRGRIDVKATAEAIDDERLRLTVTVADEGIGMSAEAAAQVFDRFRQVDDSVSRRHAGTGLGLAICKELVEAMGGSIRVETAPGRGAAFTFDVALELAPVAKAQSDAARGEGLAALAGLPVLLAEDDDINAMVVRLLLERHGASVLRARDGAEAVTMFEAHRQPLVLMDCRMPGVDGLEATARIRALPGAQPRVLALTANTLSGDRARCLEVGMDGFLTKPLDIDALDAALREL